MSGPMPLPDGSKKIETTKRDNEVVPPLQENSTPNATTTSSTAAPFISNGSTTSTTSLKSKKRKRIEDQNAEKKDTEENEEAEEDEEEIKNAKRTKVSCSLEIHRPFLFHLFLMFQIRLIPPPRIPQRASPLLFSKHLL